MSGFLASVLGFDPLLGPGIGWVEVVIVLVKTIVIFALLLLSVLFMIWFERKVHADMTNRVGPNKAGPWGVLQTLADGAKLFFKEDLRPDHADRRVFALAPFLSMVPAFVAFAVIPVGGAFNDGREGVVRVFGRDTYLQLADPPVGVLLVLAMSSIAVYGVMLAGWSSGSKYPLLGSVRASAQMISYEAALGLSVLAVVLLAGTLSTHEIVAEQAGDGILRWNIIATGLVPFLVFLVAGTAEIERPPFDLLEAEQEIVAGFSTEYSSIRFGMFYIASFMNVITTSAIMVTLFLGGPAGPVLVGPGWLWGVVWFVAKLFAFLFIFVWLRATLPRLRYDQLMSVGWKLLIPLAFAWLLLLAIINVGRDEEWNIPVVVAAAFGGLLLGWLAIIVANRVGRHRASEEVFT